MDGYRPPDPPTGEGPDLRGVSIPDSSKEIRRTCDVQVRVNYLDVVEGPIHGEGRPVRVSAVADPEKCTELGAGWDESFKSARGRSIAPVVRCVG